ncbi:hypothetical protein DFR50_1133 [Roseiarcus fermentans]|uniref:DUF192 domain-containing protein n=1 Tax=Roseiarcus fermentans TaxID=1473586 RepID=A0A366FDR2_9HYPH|nr:DUF192 domain-containing protein [Roseiarcus fermentans]RBP12814.1 hypothetical protein DFR50_1133 [Roseiarcus fermentans]
MAGVGARNWIAYALLALIVAVTGAARAEGLEPLQVVTATGAHDFMVEIAADEASRERGLMNRRYLPADHGMLFEFQETAPVAFWMKNTYIPLDMIFVSPAGVVTNVATRAEPLSERVIPSGPPCAAVLEVNGGVAAAIGVKVGDRIRHPFFKP